MVRMINWIQYSNINNIALKSKNIKKEYPDESHLMDDNLASTIKQGTQKTMSAFIDYPIKGLKGDINSNFYEFLTMGTVPYLLGSAMFMLVFNVLNLGKFLGEKDAQASSRLGKKMALGVALYGIFKSFAKGLVTKPIKLATGVNIDLPYQNKVSNLPKGTGEEAKIEVQWQQRKVFDSKEFFRKDLLKREYYDKVAKKLGLGENLNDSISETTPIIQSIVATSNAAKIISSYCWAAVGVALAMQNPWDNFFDAVSSRKRYMPNADENSSKIVGRLKNFMNNTCNLTKEFGKASFNSAKELWTGNSYSKGVMKHAGKTLVSLASLVTVGLVGNSIISAKNMAKNNNQKTIDKTKESMVI